MSCLVDGFITSRCVDPNRERRVAVGSLGDVRVELHALSRHDHQRRALERTLSLALSGK